MKFIYKCSAAVSNDEDYDDYDDDWWWWLLRWWIIWIMMVDDDNDVKWWLWMITRMIMKMDEDDNYDNQYNADHPSAAATVADVEWWCWDMVTIRLLIATFQHEFIQYIKFAYLIFF